MTASTTAKIRVPARVTATYLDGTQAWYDGNKSDDPEDRAAYALFHRIMGTPARKDGSRIVEMDAAERALLLDYASAWWIGARDNAGYEMDAMSDMRSIGALIKWLQVAEKIAAERE